MAKPIGGDWVECFDDNRSKYYYANVKTKETSWAFPPSLLKDKSVVDRQDYWVEAVDAKSNRKYYYNKITRETKWTKPECLKPRKSNNNFMTGTLFQPMTKQRTHFLTAGGFAAMKKTEVHDDDDDNSIDGDGADTPDRSRSVSPMNRGIALPGMEDRARSMSPSPAKSGDRAVSPIHSKGVALPGMDQMGRSAPPPPRNRAPGISTPQDSAGRSMSPSPADPDRAVSPFQDQRGVALPGMEDRGRALSPSLAATRSRQREDPPPSHSGRVDTHHAMSHKFAALRELELQQQQLGGEADDEMYVGYDDGTGLHRVTQRALEPPPVPLDDRSTLDAFPGRPSFVNDDHATLSLFDSLEADGLSTSEIFTHATRTLVEYAELHYVFERKGLFNRRTSLDKLLCWKADLLHRPLHYLQGELREDSLQMFRCLFAVLCM